MRLMKTILALIVLLAFGHSAQAQVKAGTAGAQFLELSASARGLFPRTSGRSMTTCGLIPQLTHLRHDT